MRQSSLLVALNDGGVLIDRGDGQLLTFLGIKFSDASHYSCLHLLESLHRLTAGQDKALLYLSFGPQRRQRLIVKTVQEGTQRRDFGNSKTQASFQADISSQDFNVFGTISADGLQEDQGLDELAFGETTLTL